MSRKKRGVFGGLVVLALVGLLVAMALTNPAKDAHEQALVDHVASTVAGDDALARFVADRVAGAVKRADVLAIDYRSYLVVSVATIDLGKAGGRLTSVGLLGQVLVR